MPRATHYPVPVLDKQVWWGKDAGPASDHANTRDIEIRAGRKERSPWMNWSTQTSLLVSYVVVPAELDQKTPGAKLESVRACPPAPGLIHYSGDLSSPVEVPVGRSIDGGEELTSSKNAWGDPYHSECVTKPLRCWPRPDRTGGKCTGTGIVRASGTVTLNPGCSY
jgi:hypothetical protein